jgi:hypothetical protein
VIVRYSQRNTADGINVICGDKTHQTGIHEILRDMAHQKIQQSDAK